MNESNARPPESGRKPYERPQVKRVPLRPEEAVLGNCKSGASSGPASGSCSSPGCSSVGS